MRSRFACLVTLALLVGCVGSATAGEVKMQVLLNSDGTGRLFVNSGGEPPWSWEACAPDLSACSQFKTGRDVSTAGAMAETAFRVSGAGLTGTSPIWHGNVFNVSPPGAVGALRANELVTPVSGQWGGGWEGEGSTFQLAACPSRSEAGCVTLTHSHYPDSCLDDAAVLDPFFTGWFLRVTERRWGTGPHITTADAVVSPYTPDTWKADAVTAVATAGRIKPATQRRTADCGPPPLVEASLSRGGVAAIRCGLSCRATLFVRQGKRRARVSRKLAPLIGRLPVGQGPPELRLRAAQLRRFEPGPASAYVEVNGRQVASRTVLLLKPATAGK
jgi:hypothetical protein